MIRSSDTLNAISGIFCLATKEVLESATGLTIEFSKTLQKIPMVHLRPDVGSFVMFNGDYSGLMIMNFDGQAALDIYRGNMKHMGLPEDELATDFTADEVADTMGELINQLIGRVRREIETKYSLTASNTPPKAIALTSAIVLTVDATSVETDLCRRISFKVNGNPFHIELSMERTEFVSMEDPNIHESAMGKHSDQQVDLENYSTEKPSSPTPAAPSQDIDIDSLMAQNQ